MCSWILRPLETVSIVLGHADVWSLHVDDVAAFKGHGTKQAIGYLKGVSKYAGPGGQ